MRISLMKNTTIYCLKALAAHGGWLNALIIARHRWPRTRQPMKKARTIRNHLDELVRHGFAIKLGDAYAISDAGRDCAQVASEGKRPIMFGLAG